MSRSDPPTADWTEDATVNGVLDAVVETVPEVRAGLVERHGYVDRENPSGERISAADAFADARLEERILAVDGVASYASEERADVADAGGGRLHVAVDPLDGSSNLRSNNPMGTIVGVYSDPLPTAGSNLVAAAYVLYGPNTTFTVSDGGTVTEYLITDDGHRVLDDDLTIDEEPTVYGIGGRRPDWPAGVRSFVESLEADRLKLRYGGALIADVTQVLTYGGCFAYPELSDRPEGKLRYHFECAPIGFLAEAAGGRVSNGEADLLEATPDSLHERTPFYVGNAELIEQRESMDG